MEKHELINTLFAKISLDIKIAAEKTHNQDWIEVRSKFFYAIWLVTKGNIFIQCEGYSYNLAKGDIFVFYPQVVYSAHTDEGGCSFIYIHFSVTSEVNQNPLNIVNLFGTIKRTDIAQEFLLIAQAFYELKNQEPVSLFRLKSTVQLFISQSARLNMRLRKPFINSTNTLFRIESLLQYIYLNIDRPLTNNELAAQMCMSEKYFISYFKRNAGYTPMKYVVLIKMNRAHELFCQGKYSVKEVAQKLGYVDSYTFSKAFKRHHGMPPSQVFNDI